MVTALELLQSRSCSLLTRNSKEFVSQNQSKYLTKFTEAQMW